MKLCVTVVHAALLSLTLTAGPIMATAQGQNPAPNPAQPKGQDIAVPAIKLFDRETIDRHAQTATSCVAFSPDGRVLAAATSDGRLHLYQVATAMLKASSEVVEDPLEAPYSIAYAPDGKTIAVGLGHGPILLCDAANAKMTGVMRGHRKYVSALAYSPDGKTLASSCIEEGVRLWDTTTGRERAVLSADTGAPRQGLVRSLAFSPNGKILALASGPRAILRWDAVTWKPLSRYQPVDAEGIGFGIVAFSPDGATLASSQGGGQRAIVLWDVATGRERAALPNPTQDVKGLGFLSGGRTLVSLGNEMHGALRTWDTMTSTSQEVINLGWSPSCLAVSPDGKTVAVGAFGGNGLMGVVELFDFDGQKLSRRQGKN